MFNKFIALSILLIGFGFSGISHASLINYNFSGKIVNPITVGPNTVAAGTPFTGSFSYSAPQTGNISSFYSGTQSVFAFTSLSLTINGQTVTESPGNLGLYNNVTPPHGVPVGDSLYTFVPGIPNNSPNASTGSINGITPNYIYLGFVDGRGNAFGSSSLPTNLNLSAFNSAFLGINYGPFGAGNTTSIHFLSSLTSVPLPSAVWLFGSSLISLLGIKSSRKNPNYRIMRLTTIKSLAS